MNYHTGHVVQTYCLFESTDVDLVNSFPKLEDFYRRSKQELICL